MRKLLLSTLSSLILTLFALPVFAQEFQVLKYTPVEIEALFLKQNLQLLAEKMNITLADAEIAQSRLWDNPQLSIGSMNLWSTAKQREELGAETFPRNTEFSIELSQLILTANKRNKLINSQKVSREITVLNFEDVLRGLKAELRKLIYETEYLQSYKDVLSVQQESLELLISAYKRQAELNNIAKNELLRLQSGLIELKNEINETEAALNEQQKNLKSLLNISPFYIIKVENTNFNYIDPNQVSLVSLLEKAHELRPDIKREQQQTLFYEKSLIYEKSQRIPDITLSASYDQYGGVWKDFIGFGISFDLPFLNRNQGNIKAAKINIEQNKLIALQLQNIAEHEITEAFYNYSRTYKFYEEIENNDLLTELDEMLGIYTKNFLNRNISMLEYLDFMESYKSNKQIVLLSRKNMYNSFVEFQYAVGTEINK
ncbi:TolC family protein [Dysgonomonas sp. Marseille-Q5470]|uniref:TolC family protein n=2 Tax=unclassified Dysgonomonas TaxID=2630389 RepID=UPI0024BBED4C|nr:TolC family protein [Dysgonomonas sp. Marseille-Q5470]MBS5980055.1 TolC family protein [Dysgonomonas mossii]